MLAERARNLNWGRILKEIKIKTPEIKLGEFLKFALICSSGGQAKAKILNSEVCVNRKICKLRGKKLKNADIVEADGVEYIIKHEN